MKCQADQRCPNSADYELKETGVGPGPFATVLVCRGCATTQIDWLLTKRTGVAVRWLA